MKTTLILFLTSAICLADIANLSAAQAALRRGEIANAEQILVTAISDAEARFGHNAPQLDSALDLLSQIYVREKRYPDAIAAQKQRLEIWGAVAGDNSVVVGRVLESLSTVERQSGDLAGAESDARRVLAIMTAAFVDKPPSAQAAVDLADILIAGNRRDEANQMLALAQKTFETSLGPGSKLAADIGRRRGQDTSAAPPVYKIGSQVTAPRILSKVEPQYSEEARKGKVEGSISINLVVDASGTPTQIAILRPLGMGLDEQAIKAVSQWKFAPGQKNGVAVAVLTQVQVTFHLL